MGGLRDGWGDGRIDGDGVQTGGEEAESSLGTFRLHIGEFQRGNWACVFTLCLSMWAALIWCECVGVCMCVFACVGGYSMCDKVYGSQKFGENH